MCNSIEEISEFRDEFLNDVLNYSNSESIFNEEGFLKLTIDKIFEEGDKYEPIEVSHNKVPTKIHAYAYGEADGVLSIFTSNFMLAKVLGFLPMINSLLSNFDLVKISLNILFI